MSCLISSGNSSLERSLRKKMAWRVVLSDEALNFQMRKLELFGKGAGGGGGGEGRRA